MTVRDRDWVPPLELDPADEAVLIEETDAALPAIPPPPEPDAPRRAGLGRWFALGLAAVLAVALGFDTADLLTRAFATSWTLGGLAVAGLALAGVSLIGMVGREFLNLRRLRRIETLRAEADRLQRTRGHGEADRYAGELAALYSRRAEIAPAMERLRELVTDAHDDGEVIRLIDREVMTEIDRRAYQAVVRAARTTALVTALSPAAIVDVAVVFWRNLKLVREVAALYGARPGYAGSLRLLRRMLANLAVAGATESVHHVAVDALGGTLAAAISTRVGQGIVNGLLTARVGLAAMHLCRPIAFSPESRPSLGHIRAELLHLPKDVL
jgi:putative membrane protein